MSPTATIATVIAALIFCAWLFQSDIRDPGYEAWKKRQIEAEQHEEARRAAAGPAVVDANVTTEYKSLEELRREAEYRREQAKYVSGSTQGLPVTDPEGDPFKGSPTPVYSGADPAANPAGGRPNPLQQAQEQAILKQGGFGSNALLEGTFIGVAYIGEVPKRSEKGDEPTITFRRDGSFTTQNMGTAEVDMEAATALGATLDRGSGHYKISGINLTLTYNDGLNRKKGNKRHYVIMPVGPEDAPTGITIQGKLFKRDPPR
jgi:hypothetical protein